MKKRREAIELAKDIYFFMKKSEEEYSINQISKLMKAKYEITVTCLEFLKEVGLIKERKGSKKPIPERLWSLK
jgi:predicted transcriptional regulator